MMTDENKQLITEREDRVTETKWEIIPVQMKPWAPETRWQTKNKAQRKRDIDIVKQEQAEAQKKL